RAARLQAQKAHARGHSIASDAYALTHQRLMDSWAAIAAFAFCEGGSDRHVERLIVFGARTATLSAMRVDRTPRHVERPAYRSHRSLGLDGDRGNGGGHF